MVLTLLGLTLAINLMLPNVTPLIGPTFRSGSFVYPSFSNAGYTRFYNAGLNGQTSLHLVFN